MSTEQIDGVAVTTKGWEFFAPHSWLWINHRKAPMDSIKFRKKVVPGDTLIFRLKLLSPIRRGIANMRAIAFVGDTVVCEGEFMAIIAKSK